MKYLILASLAEAEARSAAAYEPLRPESEPEGPATVALWTVIAHPSDGRAALAIPDTPRDAGLTLAQDAYDALLDAAEHATLVAVLPDGWLTEAP